jgi:hypothetical protein
MMTADDRAWGNRYDRYLRSEGWQLVREAALRRDGYRCRRCGVRGSPFNPLQAGHLSYAAYNRTGRTPTGDLQTLCRHCHQIVSRCGFPSRSRQLGGQSVVRFILVALAIWLLGALWRSEPLFSHRHNPPRAGGNTLIIPSRLEFQRHRHRHQRKLQLPAIPNEPPG